MDTIDMAIGEYFKEGNLLSSLVEGYKYRPDQAVLADIIFNSFVDKEFLVAEAGTGVGKTYSYLVPAAVWAASEGDKVVISTKTKALQQQLMEKDLPNVLKALELQLKFAEAKGRENFICWNKYMKIIAGRKELSPEESSFVEKILTWAEKTRMGDRKELTLKSDLMSHWGIVAADRNSCEKDMCPFTEKCFRLKMIRSLEKADIIITNHALLLSDIMVDNSILPAYKYLIIDEAHNLDREAFTRLSNRVTFAEFNDVLRGLYNKTYNRGILPRLKKEIPEYKVVIDECIKFIDRIEQLLYKFQSRWASFIGYRQLEQVTSILTEELLEGEDFNLVYEVYIELIDSLNLLIFQMEDIQTEDSDFIVLNGLLKESSDGLFKIMEENLYNSACIVWLEWQLDDVAAIASSVIRIGTVLYESLYNKLESLIMLSATITIDDKFDFFINKTGLNDIEKDSRLKTFIGESPFCYEKQAKLLVLNDLPMPNNESEFTAGVRVILKEVIKLTKGRTLILFTSRKQMKACAEELRPFAKKNKIEILVQNEDGEATSVMNAFISNENTILMGLDSFWEGVDLKGNLLTCLVIVKLPFKPPNDPLSSANDKYCRTQGLNTFNTFSLPDAVMRFKQGVGRLIRSETDEGVVIVLDNRLYLQRYGASFLRSIPIKNVHSIARELLPTFL